ncbi:type 1 glutamine amidotransferase domain-containing protein [Tamlana sp. 2201CG12-4]|uniref:type 1 glutamine amidotransferase domain-containing protein n=1 Tax=Tamlana sp. 2201CG12-4 TaxID=3112582 RepID=UPI002DBEB066|nr:type 1 glutamine amidotransferase domain-containing protein [Tamlana sp. 2201CG12-4]MEC3908118.1 type 1 glutamine amidotransferase domain-containing protein [Tamlana sp. 2201CG12-4]
MLKKYPILKWSLVAFTTLLILLFAFGWWFISLIPSLDKGMAETQVQDLPYLTENISAKRGKILAVVTSVTTMGDTDKSTGYELTELSRAYYVFQANGFEVDVASPLGGAPQVVIDDEDMGAFDYAFLNDSTAQYKVKHTIPVNQIEATDYEAVFFVGGKGTMFDFPENTAIQSIVRTLYESDKVVGAVCHGPAALINVTLNNGQHLLKNKQVSGFTNKEELLLIPDAETIFPFLLQDELMAQGARFNEGAMYLEQISHDQNLVTGQNPWSTWKLAETMVAQLGYTPKPRTITAEENAVEVLKVYYTKGSDKAKARIEQMITKEHKDVARMLFASHSIVSVMKRELGQCFSLMGLTSYAKKIAND